MPFQTSTHHCSSRHLLPATRTSVICTYTIGRQCFHYAVPQASASFQIITCQDDADRGWKVVGRIDASQAFATQLPQSTALQRQHEFWQFCALAWGSRLSSCVLSCVVNYKQQLATPPSLPCAALASFSGPYRAL